MMNERILRNICVNDNDSGLNSIPNVPIRAVVRSTIVEAAEATINIIEVVKVKQSILCIYQKSKTMKSMSTMLSNTGTNS